MCRKIFLVLISLVLLLTTACQSEKEEYYTREVYAMDTVISISIPSDTEKTEKICNDAVYYINDLDNKLSVTNDESSTSAFNSTALEYTAEDEFLDVMYYALDIAKNTEGAFDPTCLPLTRLWKISDGGYLPSTSEVNMILSNIGYEKIEINGTNITKKEAVCVDLGGIAKGFALGKVVTMLSNNSDYGMVSFGGNVGVWGAKPDGTAWEVGIKDPKNPEDVIGRMVLPELGGFVAVSGDYERYFEKNNTRFHHIFDPDSGYPVMNGVHSVAVYTRDAAIGDALSTALFVMGADKGIEFYNRGIYEFEALFVTDDGIKMTKGMEEMFVNEN